MRESYDVLNNLFYFFNLLFKTLFYTITWAFFKGWKFELLLLIICTILGVGAWVIIQTSYNMSDAEVLKIIGVIILYILYLTILVFYPE